MDIPGMSKPHAVCIPYPAQGHINPMLKLAKLLHHSGFYITFVHTEHNQRRLLKSRGSNSLPGLPDFVFETIPDGLPPTDADASQDIASLVEATSTNCLVPFRELLAKLNSSSDIPPVSCIISDGIMTFTLKAAEEIGVPDVLFWTTSACGFLGYANSKNLIERGLVPLEDVSYLTNGYLETTIDWIPGMKDIRLRDLPTITRITDGNDSMLKFTIREIEGASKASAIVLNTYDELENEVLLGLSSMFACNDWGIGMEIDYNVKRDEVEKLLKELMEGEKGKEMKKKALEWKRKAEEATAPNGSSYINLDRLIEEVLLSTRP
ncbi:hypothetical protein GH714_007455 [Hevea brasiliensis]|uniref:Glycosyltransferase N-terminal domain-containing protein n=1 Tax=Hevea brasiliensis TaxID=3981 RepID=A0A6A6KZT3_HEVBR|nr:hypothetical protein GH714_007455 [Hevea brasiliensis]